MHVIVFGAGAIGSVYAAKLAARHDVIVVGRPAHVAAINRDGLRMVGREEVTAHVRAVTVVDAIPPDSLVLLTTKVNDNAAAAADIAGAVRRDTCILCVQNGLHGERIVRDVVGDRCTVLRAITQFGAIFREPGVVDLKFCGHTLIERGEQSDARKRSDHVDTSSCNVSQILSMFHPTDSSRTRTHSVLVDTAAVPA